MRRRLLSCIMIMALCINWLPSSIFAESIKIDFEVAPSAYEEDFAQDEQDGIESTNTLETGLPDEEVRRNDNEIYYASVNEADGEQKEEERDSVALVITEANDENDKDDNIHTSKTDIEKYVIEDIQEDVLSDGDVVIEKESCNEVMVSEYDDEAIGESLAANGMYWPLDTNHGITNAFTSAHGGADLACASGTPIYAVTSGTASYYQAYRTYSGTKYLTSYGNFVRIENGSTTTLYAHMSSFEGFSLQIPSSRTKKVSGSENKISIGSRHVNEGDIIGYVGTTGNSTGPHLHFEVIINGTKMNPANYVSKSMSARDHGIGSNSCSCSDSYAGTYICTSKTTLNIRSGHNTSASIIGSIPSGAEVYVPKADGTWAHVSYNGIDGYASMSYLEKKGAYTIINDYGDDFFAFIISSNGSTWRHIANINNNVMIPEGNDSFDPRQIWHFIKQSDNSYVIWNCYDSSVLDMDWNVTNDGANIQTWNKYLGNNNQHWYIVKTGGEDVTLKTRHTDLVMDINNGDIVTGQNVQGWSINNTAAQDFCIYKLTNDGVDYKKPDRPDKLSPDTFKAQVSGNKVTLSWPEAPLKSQYDNRAYDVRIYKGDDLLEDKCVWWIGTTSADVTLDWGDYRFSVVTINTRYKDWYSISELHDFTVSKPTYTVIYNANGGSDAPSSQTKIHDQTLILSDVVPTRLGYSFVSWTTNPDGTGTEYKVGNPYTANAAVTLYAQWKQNMFALDVNGHLDSDDSATNIIGYGTVDVYINGNLVADDVSDYYMEHPYGTTYEIKDIKVNPGKSYAGISSGSRQGIISGITKVFLHFMTIPDSPGVAPVIETFGGHTYHYFDRHSTWYEARHFSEKLGGHLVTINSKEENDFVSSIVGDKNIWIGLTDEAVEEAWTWVNGEGVLFTNWSSGEPNNHAQLAEEGEDYGMLRGDGFWNDAVGPEQMGFVCEFDKVYTIRYDLNGGSGELGNQEKAHGKAITISSIVPTRDGYTFAGWSTAQNGGGMAYNVGASYEADADVTLYAQWKTAGKEMAYGYARTVPDGEYQIIAYKNPGYMLDIDGNDVPASDGSNVQLYSNENRPQDTFLLTYDSSDGCYSIIQKDTQMSLDVVDAAVTEGANVQMYHWHDVSAQKWAISWVGDVGNGIGYRIQSKCNGLSLDIVNGGSDSVYVNGTNVRMWPGNNSQAQSWMLIPVNTEHDIKDGRYILRSGVKPELELDVSGDSYDVQSGTNIQVWNDDSKDFSERALSQYNAFDVSYIGEGYYKITHAGSGLALEVAGASKERLANVCLGEEAADNYGQQWAVTAFGDGYMLRARCSGQALDVADGRTEDGTNVRQHPCAFGEAQLWYFVPAEYAVSYDANGGSGAPGSQTKYYKGHLILDAAEPERFGHVFSGWNTDRNGQGTSYAAGSLYETDADVTMYAQWTKRSYKVTYDANGGTGSPDKQMKEYGDAITLSDVVPTKQGCDFTGWNTKADGTGIAYKSNDQYVKDEDLTLYAQWENASDPMAPAPTIEVGTAKALAGNTVSVPLNIKNNPGIVSMELSIEYDADMLIWTGFEPGEFGGKIDGEVGKTLTWFGEDPKTDVTLDALIMVLNFAVKDDAEHGDAVVTVSYRDHDIFNADERNIAFEVVPGKVAVSAYTPGDINGDGMVDNKDVIRLMRHLKYNDVEYVADALDVNGDGEVGNKDVTRLMRYLKYNDVPIF